MSKTFWICFWLALIWAQLVAVASNAGALHKDMERIAAALERPEVPR